MYGCHAGSAGERGGAVFERRNQFLKRPGGGIVEARVAVTGFFMAEDAVELRHRVVEVAGGGVYGSGDGRVGPGFFPVARMDGFGVDLQGSYFLFQRMPALVSSRTMPCWSS